MTRDRGVIMHGAGARGLSPALRAGAPALVAEDDREGRCGWAAFFDALEARGEDVLLEEGAARVVPAGEVPRAAGAGRGALEEARAFLRALRG